ncbi:hypothetical protein [Rhizobium laguerreae]|uniref:hypothetical protein n=1 Tax=Rhizobium laguerreae TaxID=1076926 RepID=UPI003B973FD5
MSFNPSGAVNQFFQDCLLVEKLGLPLAGCKRQDRGKIAAQYDQQYRKLAFVNGETDRRTVSADRVQEKVSPYVVQAGTRRGEASGTITSSGHFQV